MTPAAVRTGCPGRRRCNTPSAWLQQNLKDYLDLGMKGHAFLPPASICSASAKNRKWVKKGWKRGKTSSGTKFSTPCWSFSTKEKEDASYSLKPLKSHIPKRCFRSYVLIRLLFKVRSHLILISRKAPLCPSSLTEGCDWPLIKEILFTYALVYIAARQNENKQQNAMGGIRCDHTFRPAWACTRLTFLFWGLVEVV